MTMETKGLNFGVEFNINDKGDIESLSENIRKINTQSESLATGLKKVEESYSAMTEAAKAYNAENAKSNNSDNKAALEKFKAEKNAELNVLKAQLKQQENLIKNSDALQEKSHQDTLKRRNNNKQAALNRELELEKAVQKAERTELQRTTDAYIAGTKTAGKAMEELLSQKKKIQNSLNTSTDDNESAKYTSQLASVVKAYEAIDTQVKKASRSIADANTTSTKTAKDMAKTIYEDLKWSYKQQLDAAKNNAGDIKKIVRELTSTEKEELQKAESLNKNYAKQVKAQWTSNLIDIETAISKLSAKQGLLQNSVKTDSNPAKVKTDTAELSSVTSTINTLRSIQDKAVKDFITTNKDLSDDLSSTLSKVNSMTQSEISDLGKIASDQAKINKDLETVNKNTVAQIKNDWVSGSKTAGQSIDLLVQKQKELIAAINSETNPIVIDNYKKQLANATREIQSIEKAVRSAANSMTKLDSDSAIKSEQIALKKVDYLKALNSQEIANEKLIADKKVAIAKEIAVNKEKAEKEVTEKLKLELNKQLSEYKETQSKMNSSSASLSNISKTNTSFEDSSTLKSSILSAGVSLVGIRALAAAFSNLGQDIIDVNYNAVNTQRIMKDFSEETAKELTNSAVDIAKNTGTQVTDVQEIQEAWVRVNDQYAQSKELLGQMSKMTAQFMNVGEIEDAESAVKLLNATLLQFNDGSKDTAAFAEDILNKWAYMADKTAMGTADEFGESLAKIGGYMKSLGGDVDDAIVMTSLLGDRLAKTGDEAGNALKTINSYLTRQKTVNLFDTLGSDANGVSYSLKKTNGQFKEFTDLMETASRAYNNFKAAGDDQTAKKIQEALGATRQGDVALTLLQNWDTDAQKYYGMLKDSVSSSSSYLEEQNAALMTTFKAQWNSLYATVVGMGMAIANSGILDGLTNVMGKFDDIFTSIKNLNPEVISFVTTLGTVALGVVAFKKVGEMTGILTAFTTAMKYGTEQQRLNAASVTANADAYYNAAIKEAEADKLLAIKNNDQRKLPIITSNLGNLNSQMQSYNELNALYKEGAINASQYANAVTKLAGAENLSNAAVEKAELSAYTKNAITQESIILESELAMITNTSTRATITATIARKAFTTVTKITIAGEKALNGLMQVGAMLQGALLSPLMLISVGIAAATKIFDALTVSVEEQQSKIDELQKSYDGFKTEIDELNAKAANATITKDEQDRLDYLKERLSLEKQLLDSEKKKQAQKEISGDDGLTGFFKDASAGFTGKRSQKSLYLDITSEIGLYKGLERTLSELNSQYEKTVSARKALVLQRDQLPQESVAYQKLNSQVKDYIKTEDNLSNKIKDKKGEYLEAENAVSGFMAKIKEYQDIDAFTSNEKEAYGQLYQQLEKISVKSKEAAKNISSINDIDVGIDMETFNKNISESEDAVDKLESNIKLIEEGKATVKDLTNMMVDYSNYDFFNAANAGAKEQLELLKKIKNEQYATRRATYENSINESLGQRKKLLQAISQMEKKSDGSYVDTASYNKAKSELEDIDHTIQKFKTESDITLYVDTTSLEDATNMLGDLVNSTTDLVYAQNQLSQGTALSSAELFKLAQQYPELLKQSDLFNLSSVDGQQAAIQAVMDMKEQEKNNKIDLQIQELQAEQEAINEQLKLEQLKSEVLVEIENATATATVEDHAALTNKIAEYNDLQGDNAVTLQNGKIKVAGDAATQEAKIEDDLGKKDAGVQEEKKKNTVAAAIGGGNATVKASQSTFSKIVGHAMDFFAWLVSTKTSFVNFINGLFTGKDGSDNSNTPDTGGIDWQEDDSSIEVDPGSEITFESDGVVNIGGQKIDDWISKQKEASNAIIAASQSRLREITSEINNLQDFKNKNIADIINKFNPEKDADLNEEEKAQKAAKEAAEAAEKASKEQKDAAEAAAKAAKDIADRISELTKDYISDVEKLQDDLISSLKEEYQSAYDARVKQINAEKKAQDDLHDANIKKLNEELDILNGNTKEDKEAKLTSLEDQLAEWNKDDSSTGKAKQKEIADTIKSLKKEIATDDINDQIDYENTAKDESDTHFEQLLDKNSTSYDKTLSMLDSKMADKSLADEANKMIINEMIPEMEKLLEAHKAEYDTYAYLTGTQPAQTISDGIILAISEYIKLRDGKVGADVPSGTSSGGDTSGSGSGSGGSGDQSGGQYHVVEGGDPWGDTLWDLAESYYGDGSQWEKIYNANADQIEDPNLIYPGQRLLIPFKVGGYTGEQDGAAYLHKRERVLSADQTQSFDKLVYDLLPQIDSGLMNVSGTQQEISSDNSKNVNYNGEIVKVEVGNITNNTPFDIKNSENNLNRLIKTSLQKTGTNIN